MLTWFTGLRKKANLTQQDIADEVGITRQMISAIENEVVEPSLTTAKALGTILNFSWTCFYDT